MAGVIGFGSACSGDEKSPTWQSQQPAGGASSAPVPESPIPIGATLKQPAEGAKDVPITSNISFDLSTRSPPR